MLVSTVNPLMPNIFGIMNYYLTFILLKILDRGEGVKYTAHSP